MNWGKGIIAGMIIFMLFILSMCLYMFRMPADEYDHQYYEKGLSFDRDYAREKNVVADHAQPEIRLDGKNLTLTFTGRVNGHITFVRPSNEALDRTFPLNSGSNNFVAIPLNDIKTGHWKLVMDWESNHKAYLYQQEVDIQ